MMNTIGLAQLVDVCGGTAAKPTHAAAPPPMKAPHTTTPPAHAPAHAPAARPPRRYIQDGPSGGNDGAFVRTTITCARIGGPVLGAICGALTPSPAW